jgi:hypothetical protein
MVQKAPVQKAPVQKAPVQKAPVQKAPVQKAPVQKAPVQKVPVQKVPVQKVPVQKAPDQKAPDQKAPDQKAPVQKAPVQKAPVQKAPVQKAPVQKAPAGEKTSSKEPFVLVKRDLRSEIFGLKLPRPVSFDYSPYVDFSKSKGDTIYIRPVKSDIYKKLGTVKKPQTGTKYNDIKDGVYVVTDKNIVPVSSLFRPYGRSTVDIYLSNNDGLIFDYGDLDITRLWSSPKSQI